MPFSCGAKACRIMRRMHGQNQTEAATLLFLAAIVSLASAASVAQAQSNYPNRVIKIVVAVPAGGAADTLARIVADKLTAKWGKPVIVENHPGGTGNVAAEAVWRAQPDGYTLLLTPPPPLAINQSLYAKLPFVPDKFKPVTVIAAVPNVLLVHHDFPASNLRELIALAKANPNKFSYASTGPGSTSHLSAELMKSVAGINILHVPYKSPSEAILDVLSRRVDMTFANLLDALPHINDGALRVLGVGSSARSFALPDVPTLSETLPGSCPIPGTRSLHRRNTSRHRRTPLLGHCGSNCTACRSAAPARPSCISDRRHARRRSSISEGRNRALAQCDRFGWDQT